MDIICRNKDRIQRKLTAKENFNIYDIGCVGWYSKQVPDLKQKSEGIEYGMVIH